MAIKMGKGDNIAVVTIDREHCVNCGTCARNCNSLTLLWKDGRVEIDDDSILGCVGCGACVTRCPKGCISVEGRDFHMTDVRDIPPSDARATFAQIHSLMMARRSCRSYLDRAVEPAIVGQILQAASTAPMGVPPSGSKVLVLDSSAKVREFAWDFVDYIAGFGWLFRPPVLYLWKLTGRTNYDMMDTFVRPLIEVLDGKKSEGTDWLFYGAPLAMYFYTDGFSDPADPYVNATYAMLAAESLGLGTCMIGSVGQVLQMAGKRIKQKYGLPPKVQQGLVVLFGYPANKPRKSVVRRLAGVTYYKT